MQINQELAGTLCEALGFPKERSPEIARSLATPPNLALGDVAFPCFALAKELRAAPKDIAARLAAGIGSGGLIARAVAQGPYLNLFLERGVAGARILGSVLEAGADYGRQTRGEQRVIVLDFSHPNIAKPFHFGHLRSTNIGADLARIFDFMGYRVVRKNYLGDWGTQFGFVIYAWRRWGDPGQLEARAIDYLVELYIKANQHAERDESIREQARNYFLRLEKGDPEIRSLWEKFRELSLAAFMETYERLGIAFDSYEGEAAINPRVDEVVERFVAARVARESEGALVVDIADVLGREIAPCMLRKSDGASTYAARDCAEAIERWERYGFSANIYVVSRQEDHFAQVFAALGKLARAEGWPVEWPATCENISFGFVRGMSTRKGEAVWLADVLDEARDQARRVREEKAKANPGGFPALSDTELDEVSEAVGQAALLYFDVSARRTSDITFDWKAVLQFEGNTGPYLQYSHARMCGIFRKAAARGLDTSSELEREGLAFNDEEWQLLLQLRGFGAAVARACEQREPYEVARFLYELCSAFNGFYNKHVIIGEDRVTSQRRLALVRAARTTLANGLALLGIRALEYM